MSDERPIELPEGLVIQVGDGTGNEQYRTCQECGRDCVPEHAGSDDMGARIAFVCPEHRLHSVVDPFEHLR